MNITLLIRSFFVACISMMVIACSSTPEAVSVEIEPTAQLDNELKGTMDYAIVLDDMDIKEKDGKLEYQHKYHVLKIEQDTMIVDSTGGWRTVNQSFFEKHENNLGMEIQGRHDGTYSDVAQPVGFGWAVGNEKFGEWVNENGEVVSTESEESINNSRSRWRSSGPSWFLLYWATRRPAYRSDYRGYRQAKAAGKPYYGQRTGSAATYGTNSATQRARRPGYYARRATSSTFSRASSSKTSRNSSRYKSSSSTRSRSGGFGK